jgi:predicted enzyme related to lactoylglutathione lyase
MAGITILLLAATPSPDLEAQSVPAVTSPATDTHHVGKFVWWDLVTPDVGAAAAFYGQVLGWDVEPLADDYAVISNDGQPIAGITESEGPNEVGWIGSLSVGSADGAADWAKGNGGRVLDDPVDVPDRGRMAVLADAQGAVFTALVSSSGDPEDTDPAPGDWAWAELWTTDIDAAADFYRRLVGYQFAAVHDGAYHVFGRYDVPRAGVVEIEWAGIEPNWLPYVKVADLGAVVRRVEEAGGKVLQEPTDDFEDGRVAFIGDPTGGVLAVWEGGP